MGERVAERTLIVPNTCQVLCFLLCVVSRDTCELAMDHTEMRMSLMMMLVTKRSR